MDSDTFSCPKQFPPSALIFDLLSLLAWILSLEVKKKKTHTKKKKNGWKSLISILLKMPPPPPLLLFLSAEMHIWTRTYLVWPLRSLTCFRSSFLRTSWSFSYIIICVGTGSVMVCNWQMYSVYRYRLTFVFISMKAHSLYSRFPQDNPAAAEWL